MFLQENQLIFQNITENIVRKGITVQGNVWVVHVGDNYYHVWDGDMEIVEEWSEEVEGKDI